MTQPKRKSKLRDLKVNRIALVDKGANVGAVVMLFKRDLQPEGEIVTDPPAPEPTPRECEAFAAHHRCPRCTGPLVPITKKRDCLQWRTLYSLCRWCATETRHAGDGALLGGVAKIALDVDVLARDLKVAAAIRRMS